MKALAVSKALLWELLQTDGLRANANREDGPSLLIFVPVIAAACLPAFAASMNDSQAGKPRNQLFQAAEFREPPPPLLLKPLTADAARAANLAIPFAAGPIEPARPFQFAGDRDARARALECLTEAVYYEAGNESTEGQEAVAQVVLNRVRHPAFPASVCGVIFQGSTQPTGCQFTFTCDGSLLRPPERSRWVQAQAIAQKALSGGVYVPVGLSTHYHADYVLPYWATSLAKDAVVGTHIFYRWPGSWGQPETFYQRYARKELNPYELRTAALLSHGLWPGAQVAEQRVIDGTIDPNFELAGVVALLASGPRADDTQYDKDARSYFGAYAGHDAVRIFREMRTGQAVQQAWTQASVFSAAVRDFGRDSGFDRFIRNKQDLYDRLSMQAARAVAPAVAAWVTYTAIPVRSRKVTWILGRDDDPTVCLARELGSTGAVRFHWSPAYANMRGPDLFIALGLGDDLLRPNAKGGEGLEKGIEEQIVRAVFVRSEALQSGEHAGELAAAREADRGFSLVPALAQELKAYERNRDRYRSLVDFVPVLLARAGSAHQSQSARASQPSAQSPDCQQPDPPRAVAAGRTSLSHALR